MSNFIPEDSPMYNWSNPKRVGPGTWYMFMLMSCHAKTKQDRIGVCAQIRLFGDYFGCANCKEHCRKYLEENPPELAVEGEYELFDWVVTFMNAVNIRLQKPIYDRNILIKNFTVQGFKVCDANCDQEPKPITRPQEHTKYATSPVIAPVRISMSSLARPSAKRSSVARISRPSSGRTGTSSYYLGRI